MINIAITATIDPIAKSTPCQLRAATFSRVSPIALNRLANDPRIPAVATACCTVPDVLDIIAEAAATESNTPATAAVAANKLAGLRLASCCRPCITTNNVVTNATNVISAVGFNLTLFNICDAPIRIPNRAVIPAKPCTRPIGSISAIFLIASVIKKIPPENVIIENTAVMLGLAPCKAYDAAINPAIIAATAVIAIPRLSRGNLARGNIDCVNINTEPEKAIRLKIAVILTLTPDNTLVAPARTASKAPTPVIAGMALSGLISAISLTDDTNPFIAITKAIIPNIALILILTPLIILEAKTKAPINPITPVNPSTNLAGSSRVTSAIAETKTFIINAIVIIENIVEIGTLTPFINFMDIDIAIIRPPTANADLIISSHEKSFNAFIAEANILKARAIPIIWNIDVCACPALAIPFIPITMIFIAPNNPSKALPTCSVSSSAIFFMALASIFIEKARANIVVAPPLGMPAAIVDIFFIPDIKIKNAPPTPISPLERDGISILDSSLIERVKIPTAAAISSNEVTFTILVNAFKDLPNPSKISMKLSLNDLASSVNLPSTSLIFPKILSTRPSFKLVPLIYLSIANKLTIAVAKSAAWISLRNSPIPLTNPFNSP